ncbi:unnamed protein product [Cunninghamella blakesleeana]
MIIDYFEVEHDEAALDIIESTIVDHRKPSTLILITLFNLLLRPKEVTPQSCLKALTFLDKIHNILLTYLEIFGSELFMDVWNTFRSFHLFGFKTRKQDLLSFLISHHNDNISDDDKPFTIRSMEDNLLLDQGFMRFDDFWDFVNKTFTSKESLQVKGYLHVLHIMIEILEQDFISKKASTRDARKSIFVLLLEKRFEGYTSFEKYLNVIINAFEHNQFINPIVDVERMVLAGKLLNLMIAISYYDEILSAPSLIKQTHRIIRKLDTNDYIRCLQHISFHTFIIKLCELEFIEADWSEVEAKHQNMKKNIHNTPTLELVEHAVTKIKPKKMEMDAIYLHVLMINQYYQSLIFSKSIRIDSSIIYDDNGLAETLLTDPQQLLKTWCNKVKSWLNFVNDMDDDDDTNIDMKHHLDYLIDNFNTNVNEY